MVKAMFQIIKSKGFALPSAIFLLVVLSLMSVGLLLINSFLQKNSTLDILDTKAYLAAKAGLEYGLYQANKSSVCLSSGQTINLSGSFFQGFKATYSCSSQTSNEAGNVLTYYTITSNGCNTSSSSCPELTTKPNNEDYVEKSLLATIAK
jgi:MSHA biogenesis protein MshP